MVVARRERVHPPLWAAERRQHPSAPARLRALTEARLCDAPQGAIELLLTSAASMTQAPKIPSRRVVPALVALVVLIVVIDLPLPGWVRWVVYAAFLVALVPVLISLFRDSRDARRLRSWK
jgi:hypothetical protein